MFLFVEQLYPLKQKGILFTDSRLNQADGCVDWYEEGRSVYAPTFPMYGWNMGPEGKRLLF